MEDNTKLESGALYRVVEGADTRQTKTIPLVRVKGEAITFKMGLQGEFAADNQPTQLSDLDTTSEISAVGFYQSTSLQLIDYLGYTGNGIVVIKGIQLKKISN